MDEKEKKTGQEEEKKGKRDEFWREESGK
jgi:hypothetical protein